MKRLLLYVMCAAGLSSVSFAAGTLYISTDNDVFGGGAGGHIGVTQTNAAAAVSTSVIATSFAVNGIGAGTGFLFTGDPNTNTLNRVTLAGALISTVAGGFPNTCCNESMVFDGTNLWHVHYADQIQKLDPTTGAVITSYPQTNIVGITLVNGQLWISNWGSGSVGTWTPATNTFTPVFNAGAGVGALAYDQAANILWVGVSGGGVVPYSLTGTALNAGFKPFGTISNTIDGMTFISGAITATPLPSSLLLTAIALAGLGAFMAFGWRRSTV